MPSQKPVKLVSKQEEKELLAIGEELFRTEFPNEWRHPSSRPGGSISQKPPSAEGPDAERKSQKEKAPEPRQREQGTAIAGQQPQPKVYQDVVLDVRDQAITRGENTMPAKKKYPQIPRGQLNLSIYLPFGSEAGKYEVTVYKSPNKALLDTTGMARVRKSITVLEIKVDTSQMSPGQYVLETRRGGWTSGYKYTFLVAE